MRWLRSRSCNLEAVTRTNAVRDRDEVVIRADKEAQTLELIKDRWELLCEKGRQSPQKWKTKWDEEGVFVVEDQKFWGWSSCLAKGAQA